ncbi:hypothetical protein FQN57_002698 [Myotisia sp. PD_48]|nr:hypothetical protein FQN57_002698 [Myotisia sp. PD_48]
MSSVGYFREDSWFCECELKAKTYTSRKEHSKGKKFFRCPQPIGVKQCDFFLWEEDEAAAKEARNQTYQPRPQTPPNRAIGIGGLLTPVSHGSGKPDALSLVHYEPKLSTSPEDTTPTKRQLSFQERSLIPHRRDNGQVARLNSTNDEDLFGSVIELLQSHRIDVNTSTKLRLEHMIRLTVDTYETKLRSYENTIIAFSETVDELERRK